MTATSSDWPGTTPTTSGLPGTGTMRCGLGWGTWWWNGTLTSDDSGALSARYAQEPSAERRFGTSPGGIHHPQTP